MNYEQQSHLAFSWLFLTYFHKLAINVIKFIKFILQPFLLPFQIYILLIFVPIILVLVAKLKVFSNLIIPNI